MMKTLKPNNSGETLVSTLVAVAVMGTISAAMYGMYASNLRVVGGVNDRSDIQAVRLKIISKIDCTSTLGAGGGGLTLCNNNIDILGRNSNGSIASLSNGTAGTGAFAGSFQYSGEWFVRATCVPTGTGAGLTVRIAKRSGSGFAKDGISGKSFDFRDMPLTPINPILGGAAQMNLCQDYFSGTPTTPAVATCTGNDFVEKVIVDGETSVVEKVICHKADTDKISNGAITNQKVVADSFIDGKIGVNAVGNTKIAPLSVDTADLDNSSIISSKFAQPAITNIKIDRNAVNSAKIADWNVLKTHLAPNALNNRKIGIGAVWSLDLRDGAVQNNDIKNDAVNLSKLKNVTGADIRFGQVSVWKADFWDPISNDRIITGSLSGLDFYISGLSNTHIGPRAITGRTIANFSLTGNDFANGTVTGFDIGIGQILPSHIGTVCAQGEILRWDSLLMNWKCGALPRVEVAIAGLKATGTIGTYSKSIEVVAGPPGIWTTTHYNEVPPGTNQFDSLGCDASQGWKVTSCFVYSTDEVLGPKIMDNMNDPLSDPKNFINIDRDSWPDTPGNFCTTNDMWQIFELATLSNETPDFTNYWYKMFTVCVRSL